MIFGGQGCDYLLSSFNFLVDSDVVYYLVDSDETISWAALTFLVDSDVVYYLVASDETISRAAVTF